MYWAKEGRSSVDAAVIAATLMGLAVLGTRPFDVSDDGPGRGSWLTAIVGIAVYLSSIFICFMKKRIAHGVFGFFIQPLAIYGALRLGKPDSGWAAASTASGTRRSRRVP